MRRRGGDESRDEGMRGRDGGRGGGGGGGKGRGLSKLSIWPQKCSGLIYLNSACQLFRQITWKTQNETTYKFYSFYLEGLGYRV